MEYVIFEVSGGIGKCIMATAVIEGIKKKYEDKEIVVTSGHPDVFYNNPNVHRSYDIEKLQYFYEDYIENKNSIILRSDPYFETGYINNESHCIESWFKQSDLEYEGEKPKLFLTLMEEEIVYKTMMQWDKPVFLIHPFGGPPSHGSWVRDMPDYVIKDVVSAASKDYTVIQIKLEEQPQIPEAQTLTADSIRQVFGFIKYSAKRFLIDSFAQHAAFTLGKPSTVIWPVNKVKNLGYSFHDNIVATNMKKKSIHLSDAYLHPDDIVGKADQYPLGSGVRAFDTQIILESLFKNSV